MRPDTGVPYCAKARIAAIEVLAFHVKPHELCAIVVDILDEPFEPFRPRFFAAVAKRLGEIADGSALPRLKKALAESTREDHYEHRSDAIERLIRVIVGAGRRGEVRYCL